MNRYSFLFLFFFFLLPAVAQVSDKVAYKTIENISIVQAMILTLTSAADWIYIIRKLLKTL